MYIRIEELRLVLEDLDLRVMRKKMLILMLLGE